MEFFSGSTEEEPEYLRTRSGRKQFSQSVHIACLYHAIAWFVHSFFLLRVQDAGCYKYAFGSGMLYCDFTYFIQLIHNVPVSVTRDRKNASSYAKATADK
jgi:hypothetical protein